MLDPHRDADQLGENPTLGLLLDRQLLVRRGRGVNNELVPNAARAGSVLCEVPGEIGTHRLGVSDVCEVGRNLERVNHPGAEDGVAPDAERQHAAKVVFPKLPLRDLVVRV